VKFLQQQIIYAAPQVGGQRLEERRSEGALEPHSTRNRCSIGWVRCHCLM
jgi:hypothetical protein